MSKGSEQRPGTGYADNWDAIFKKPPEKPEPAKQEQQEREQARPYERRRYEREQP